MIKVNAVIKYCIILLLLIMKCYQKGKGQVSVRVYNGIPREQKKTRIISPFIDIVIRNFNVFSCRLTNCLTFSFCFSVFVTRERSKNSKKFIKWKFAESSVLAWLRTRLQDLINYQHFGSAKAKKLYHFHCLLSISLAR